MPRPDLVPPVISKLILPMQPLKWLLKASGMGDASLTSSAQLERRCEREKRQLRRGAWELVGVRGSEDATETDGSDRDDDTRRGGGSSRREADSTESWGSCGPASGDWRHEDAGEELSAATGANGALRREGQNQNMATTPHLGSSKHKLMHGTWRH